MSSYLADYSMFEVGYLNSGRDRNITEKKK